MDGLIKVNEQDMTVSARDLYDALEMKRRFSEWFKSFSAGFEEGTDYRGAYASVQGNQYGGTQKVQDYILTVDMAKHICLMSQTEKGKLCRQYLIDLEKAWNTPEQIMARALKIANEKMASLQTNMQALLEENEEMRPKAEYFDELVDRNTLTNFRDTAKELGVKESDFIKWLQDRKFVYRDGKKQLRPYAGREKYFRIKEYSSRYSDHSGIQTLITPEGREALRLLLKEKIIDDAG